MISSSDAEMYQQSRESPQDYEYFETPFEYVNKGKKYSSGMSTHKISSERE
jgi:hypothetical protein